MTAKCQLKMKELTLCLRFLAGLFLLKMISVSFNCYCVCNLGVKGFIELKIVFSQF